MCEQDSPQDYFYCGGKEIPVVVTPRAVVAYEATDFSDSLMQNLFLFDLLSPKIFTEQRFFLKRIHASAGKVDKNLISS